MAANSQADGHDFVLIRYNADGSLDTSFDDDGIVITDLSLGGSANAVSLQSDGKIIAAGYYVNGYPIGDFAVVRYNGDGSLDPSFGAGGIVTTDLGGNFDGIGAVAIQGDGKIVVGGSNENIDGSTILGDFALARYNNDGSLDTGFGVNGTIVTKIGDISYISRMLLQNDGKIVTAGNSSLGFTLARYLNHSNNITSVSPTSGGSLQQPSTGLNGTVGVTLTVPGGAVTQETTLVFNNQSASGNPTTGFALGGIVFSLEAFVNNVQQPNFTFITPATLTFTYSDADVAGLPGGESSLELRYWDGSAWSTDGITRASHDLNANTITFQITHLTEFSLLGAVSSNTNTYIPIIVK